MTQKATPSPAPDSEPPNTYTNPTIVPENETPEARKQRLLDFANQLKQMTPEELALITQQHPQRNIPHIILMIGCSIGILELVEWVCQNHPDVVNLTASPDTMSILQAIGIPYSSM